MIDPAVRVNWNHPLNRGLVCWWLAGVPGLSGGKFWYDVCRRYVGTLNQFAWTTDWRGTSRRGGRSELTTNGGTKNIVANIPQAGTLTQLTVAAWIKTTNAATQMAAVDRYAGSGTRSWWMGTESGGSGRMLFLMSSDGSTLHKHYNGPVITDGIWTHVGFTFAANNLRTFTNGKESTNTKITDSTCNSLHNSSANVQLCAFNSTSGPWIGQLDCVQIWYRTLSDQEMQANFQLTSQLLSPLFAPLPSVENAVASSFQPAWGRSANHLISAV